MRIPREIYEQMLAHAREEAPNECCGLIGGGDGEARVLHRARNAAASPFRYEIDGQEIFDLNGRIEEAGETLVAIYHSHTASPAYPSETDINLAFWGAPSERALAWPGVVYLIISLVEGEEPLRGFEITEEAEVTEAELTVE